MNLSKKVRNNVDSPQRENYVFIETKQFDNFLDKRHRKSKTPPNQKNKNHLPIKKKNYLLHSLTVSDLIPG